VVPRHGLGQQVQRSSGWILHDRITFPQICSSRSPPLHRPRQSALRYPAVATNRYPIHSVQRDPPLVHEPLPRRPTCFIGPIPITHLIRGVQIPIINAAPSTSLSRGFLHQRFADGGPRSARRHLHGAAIRKPSCSRRSGLQPAASGPSRSADIFRDCLGLKMSRTRGAHLLLRRAWSAPSGFHEFAWQSSALVVTITRAVPDAFYKLCEHAIVPVICPTRQVNFVESEVVATARLLCMGLFSIFLAGV